MNQHIISKSDRQSIYRLIDAEQLTPKQQLHLQLWCGIMVTELERLQRAVDIAALELERLTDDAD